MRMHRENEIALFTSPRVRGEVEGAKRTRVRGPLRDSELLGSFVAAQKLFGTLRPRRRPLTPPSPRTRGEGAASGPRTENEERQCQRHVAKNQTAVPTPRNG